MTTNTIINEVGKYLSSLTATNAICNSFGSVFIDNKNLYYGRYPSIATPYLSVIPYGSENPTSRDKFNSHLQIRVRTRTTQSNFKVSQALINNLHMNHNVVASSSGIVLANQSQPIMLPPLEGGEWIIGVVNLTIKHVKL
jgi:hypothetical protein